MRAVIGASLVLATIASVAACGTVAAPGAGGPNPHPGVASMAPAVPGPPSGSRAEAAALARQLLSRLRLPDGARRLPGTPVPAAVSEPAFHPAADGTYLDLHQLFGVAQPLGALASLMVARVPAGMSLSGTGQTGGPGGVTTREVDYTPRSVPAGIYSAQLVLTMAPDGSGKSLLRADAQVIWYPSRTAAEYIDPARYPVLTIAVTLYGTGVRTIHRVVTSRAVITALAEALNRSPAEPPLTISCPASFAEYQLALSVSRNRRPVVVITTNESSCGGSGITVDGRSQPPLADGGAVAAIVNRALGINPHP